MTRPFVQALSAGVCLLALSGCTGSGFQPAGKDQVAKDSADKGASAGGSSVSRSIGQVFHEAEDKTNQSMQQLGPRLKTAQTKLQPALSQTEQDARIAGGGLAKMGLEFGNAIDNSAKSIKKDLEQKQAAEPTHESSSKHIARR